MPAGRFTPFMTPPTPGRQGYTLTDLARDYNSGLGYNSIAKKYGISTQSLISDLTEIGYPGIAKRPNDVPTSEPIIPSKPPAKKATSPSGMPTSTGGLSQAQVDAQTQAAIAAALAGAGVGGTSSGSAAADLAEKRREFDITTQRDIAKQNATEVDALQKMLAGLSGPKDVYADLFFSHGLLPPQGYKPAPVPLTQAQKDAYGSMGVNEQQLQQMITGTGQPGADTGMLGSLGQSLQTQPGLPQLQAAQSPTTPQAPANPTVQGGALYGKAPAGTSVTNTIPPPGAAPPTTPGGVPSMAVGGTVPGPPMTPKLAVVHGGEQVTPAPGTPGGEGAEGPEMPGASDEDEQAQGGVTAIPSLKPGGGGAMSGAMQSPGLHPAIAALIDAVSNLLSNPDFRPFVEAAEKTPVATPGGVQSMAVGGTVDTGVAGGGLSPSQALSYQQTGRNPTLTPPQITQPSPVIGGAPTGPVSTAPVGASSGAATKPLPTPASGIPQAGAQGVAYNTGTPAADNPVMPISKMDPYTRALYDVHGRLHPYSAQQEMEMGPQGTQAVSSYIGKVLGGDVNAYTDLVNRLKPQGAAPTASTGTATEGFSFG